MPPVAVLPSTITALKESVAALAVSAPGATLVIGSPATAHDGSYQATIASLGGSDAVEKQMVDRILDDAVTLQENKYASISVVLDTPTPALLKPLLSALVSLGTLTFSNLTPESHTALSSEATLAGYIVLQPADCTSTLKLQKPRALTAIPLRRGIAGGKKKALWTLSSPSTPPIDADALLTAEDKLKPVPVCEPPTQGAPKRKKACKNCTCGLKELEEEETRQAQKRIVVVLDGDEAKEVAVGDKERLVAAAKAAPKATSSCGSCYLGDAFRCASCPYLGLPAFEPGQKVEIGLGADDI